MKIGIEIDEDDLLEYPYFLKYIPNPSENLLIKIVKYDKCMEYIPQEFYTYDLLKTAIEINPYNIVYVEEQNYELQKLAIDMDVRCFSCIKNPYYDICVQAVKYSGINLCNIKNPDIELCKHAIDQNVNSIRYIKNPSEEICMYAINVDPSVIRYIKNITDELYYLAFSVDIDKTTKYSKIPQKFYNYLIEKQPSVIFNIIRKYTEDDYHYVEYAINLDSKIKSSYDKMYSALDRFCFSTLKNIYIQM